MPRLLAGLASLGLVALFIGVLVPVVSSAFQSIVLQPGDDLTVNCGTTLSGSVAGQQATFTCAPDATATATRTPTNTPTPTATTQAGNNSVTIFANSAPADLNGDDVNSVEVGVKFRSDTPGTVTGVRFYKLASNTGAHTGSVWSSSGALLATAMFTGESGSGWQQANFNAPVAIFANTTYVVSYHTSGHYVSTQSFFDGHGVDNGPLHALANGDDGPNGLYAYSSSTAFPSSSFNAANYWVDVIVRPAAASSTATPTRTATPSPTRTPTATATRTPTSACPCTIFPGSAVPIAARGTDGNSVEVGVKFRSDADGFITGIRFYKLSVNTRAHVAHLWSGNGTLLATAAFSNESASGWQQVSLSPPVRITANTTYVASYHTEGHYAGDQNYFTQSVDNPPLHAMANGTDGPNGVYTYSLSAAFPSSTFNAANYWVDVVFSP